jgi:hypothetical protein
MLFRRKKTQLFPFTQLRIGILLPGGMLSDADSKKNIIQIPFSESKRLESEIDM